MSVNITQNTDGSMGLSGVDAGLGSFIPLEFAWIATSVDRCFFTATRSVVVQAIIARPEVVGSDGSAVTAVIRKVPSGTALTSGTALHSGSINLKGTAATNQTLTLSTTASDLRLAPGDSLAVDYSGTLTAAVGSCTVHIAPV